jgi:hypothetical protein
MGSHPLYNEIRYNNYLLATAALTDQKDGLIEEALLVWAARTFVNI